MGSQENLPRFTRFAVPPSSQGAGPPPPPPPGSPRGGNADFSQPVFQLLPRAPQSRAGHRPGCEGSRQDEGREGVAKARRHDLATPGALGVPGVSGARPRLGD